MISWTAKVSTIEIVQPKGKVKSTPSQSFQQLRDAQVKKMIAGEKFHTPATPWPEASQKMISKWMNRHPAFKTFSANYTATQKRMLLIAQVPPQDRFEEFEKICFQRCLAPTTAETYWTTLVSIQKSLGLEVSDADQRITRLMKARSVAYPVNFPTPATMNDIQLLSKTFAKELPSLVAVIAMTFVLGQRISDMIQLATADLDPQQKFLTITVRRGKTFTTAKPYTLWLRRNIFPTEEMVSLLVRSKKANRIFLLSESNSESERNKISQTIHEMLIAINDNLELRSLRRGGLHLMAENGHSMESILNFSRHADVDMLMRYLDWGKVSADRRDEMLSVVDSSTNSFPWAATH